MAGIYDFTLEQGATFKLELEWIDNNDAPVNLTGYTARMQIRYKKKTGDLATSLTTENGLITLYPDTGVIELEIEATETEILSIGKSVYDLELESADGIVYRVMEGVVTISGEVTR